MYNSNEKFVHFKIFKASGTQSNSWDCKINFQIKYVMYNIFHAKSTKPLKFISHAKKSTNFWIQANYRSWIMKAVLLSVISYDIHYSLNTISSLQENAQSRLPITYYGEETFKSIPGF